MKFVLWALAIVAIINGALGIGEVLQISTDPKATVFQQVSMRLNMGLSLVVFTVAVAGLAIIAELADNRAESDRGNKRILDKFGQAIAVLNSVNMTPDKPTETAFSPRETSEKSTKVVDSFVSKYLLEPQPRPKG